MTWTHVLAFGLGALWMLVVFVTASAMRSPRSGWVEESQLQMPRTWTEVQTESASRYYD
ncbi:MAG: hypothetical protein HKO63_04995 [Acidimicrobiia bacterium]|nr:hypothetical protein [Acidimicrobiia bacterium]MBT8193885.1 hypothetical protein [Acidimicrobiia bacterium]NNF87808.1 hypothetical protein [Acidimicrobiia bacterium]NNJ48352.1 hypothetical protein [Acidimicrobiia bacterium]NNL13062.1 hypothetical protein [Acidimicrobiia bacterium]